MNSAMCNHKFKEKSRATHRKCRVQETLNLALSDPNLYFNLDYDSEGVCLFHSSDIGWKKQNKFAEKFESLLNIIIQSKLSPDFSEFHFVADKDSLVIKDKEIRKHLIFIECTFHDKLIIDNLNISNSTFVIEDCLFKKGFTLTDSTIDDIHLVNTRTSTFGMNNVKVMYSTALFNYFISEKEFVINNCYFENGIDFNYAQFLDERSGAYGELVNVEFLQSKIVGSANFIETQFNGSVTFNDVEFAGSANFIDTIFSFTRRLTFENIKLSEHTMMQFRASNEAKKLFNSMVYFAIEEKDINGIIAFENVNFHNIQPTDKSYLLSLQKSGKVEIGHGCIKYRLQTPIRSIELRPENQSLVIELANTFSQFFKSSYGLNLGVEITGQDENYIHLFYFTDANISYKEFEKRLNKSESELWQLVSVKKQNVQTERVHSSLPDRLLEGTDTIINLVGIILKVATRLPLGRINSNELNSLFYTTSFGASNKLALESIKTININQTILLGIGNTQEISI
jgi:hypothetical protein